MRHAILSTLAMLLSAAWFAHPHTQSVVELETRLAVSLRHGDREMTAVRILNTGSRTFTDDSSRRTCVLSAEKQGVIWRIVLEGQEISADDITFHDERNRIFEPACWSEKKSGIFARNRVGETLMFVAGPADSRTITLRLGDVSAAVAVRKGEGQAPASTNPARDVIISVSGEIMEGIVGLEMEDVRFLTSARQPLRSLEDLIKRGYKVSVYEGDTGGLPLGGRLMGNVLRHVQTAKPWQFDVLGPSSYLSIFKEDPPVALVVTYRQYADKILSAGDALQIRFQAKK